MSDITLREHMKKIATKGGKAKYKKYGKKGMSSMSRVRWKKKLTDQSDEKRPTSLPA